MIIMPPSSSSTPNLPLLCLCLSLLFAAAASLTKRSSSLPPTTPQPTKKMKRTNSLQIHPPRDSSDNETTSPPVLPQFINKANETCARLLNHPPPSRRKRLAVSHTRVAATATSLCIRVVDHLQEDLLYVYERNAQVIAWDRLTPSSTSRLFHMADNGTHFDSSNWALYICTANKVADLHPLNGEPGAGFEGSTAIWEIRSDNFTLSRDPNPRNVPNEIISDPWS